MHSPSTFQNCFPPSIPHFSPLPPSLPPSLPVVGLEFSTLCQFIPRADRFAQFYNRAQARRLAGAQRLCFFTRGRKETEGGYCWDTASFCITSAQTCMRQKSVCKNEHTTNTCICQCVQPLCIFVCVCFSLPLTYVLHYRQTTETRRKEPPQ